MIGILRFLGYWDSMFFAGVTGEVWEVWEVWEWREV